MEVIIAKLLYSALIPVVEFPLLEQGGVARSAGVVRNGDPTNQIGALYVYARKANMTFYDLFPDRVDDLERCHRRLHRDPLLRPAGHAAFVMAFHPTPPGSAETR